MPNERAWESYFAPEQALRKLGLRPETRCVVDFGCGYGTFSIPAARIVSGTVHALDIDPQMVAATQARAEAAGLTNVRPEQRDFVEQDCGLPDGSADYVMLFNILHAERPEALLREARRVLGSGGTLAIMHWNYDSATPRGPSMAIRPRPAGLIRQVVEAGFVQQGPPLIDLPPYHYGAMFGRAE